MTIHRFLKRKHRKAGQNRMMFRDFTEKRIGFIKFIEFGAERRGVHKRRCPWLAVANNAHSRLWTLTVNLPIVRCTYSVHIREFTSYLLNEAITCRIAEYFHRKVQSFQLQPMKATCAAHGSSTKIITATSNLGILTDCCGRMRYSWKQHIRQELRTVLCSISGPVIVVVWFPGKIPIPHRN